MSKTILQAASAVIGLALLAGATGTLLASDRQAGPVKNGSCYFTNGLCTYSNGGYWSNCSAGLEEKWYPTSVITDYCSTYTDP